MDLNARLRHLSKPVVLIVAVFVLSRAAAYAAGLRFDDGLLHNAFQLLDVRLLRDDPFVSIYYLHSQPPVFNAFTAVVLQLPHAVLNTTLALLWHAMSLATALILYCTMVRLGVRTPLAAGIMIVFLLAPEVLLTESWFFYTEPQLLLTALMLLGLARYAETDHTRDGLLFTGSLGALVLLRASLHVALMLVLLTIVWRQLRVEPRRLAAMCAVPLVLVGAWTLKNVVVFDTWSSSTWAGMNLSYVARAGTTQRRCEQLVRSHDVSAFACGVAFRRPEVYERFFRHPHRYGVAATDHLYKSTGQPNFNASLYLDVASRYQHDAEELLKDGGLGAVTRAELAAYTVWAEPADDTLQLRKVRRSISGYADWFDRVVLLRPVASGHTDPLRFSANAGGFPWGDALGSISYTWLAAFVLALYGAVAGWRRRAPNARVLRIVCAVSTVVLVYSVVLGNALDYRENNRFRLEVAPVILVLGAVGAELILRRRAERRRANV